MNRFLDLLTIRVSCKIVSWRWVGQNTICLKKNNGVGRNVALFQSAIISNVISGLVLECTCLSCLPFHRQLEWPFFAIAFEMLCIFNNFSWNKLSSSFCVHHFVFIIFVYTHMNSNKLVQLCAVLMHLIHNIKSQMSQTSKHTFSHNVVIWKWHATVQPSTGDSRVWRFTRSCCSGAFAARPSLN